MIASEAISMIRFKTGRDNTGHVTDASLYPELQLETRNLRNWLAEKVPSAFENVESLTIESNGDIIVPADYRKMIRLEQLTSGSGTTARYDEVPHANMLRPQDGAGLTWRETEFHFRLAISPPDSAVLVTSYRLTYVSVAGLTITDGNGLIDVPDGFEQVVVYRVCSTVCMRAHDEEKAAYFDLKVDGIPGQKPGLLDELTRALRRRTGVHARPGFTATRGYYRSRGGIP